MASSLQRMKQWSELEHNLYYRRQFTVYYKGTWYWSEHFNHKQFRKWNTLEKFYNDYCK